MINFPKIFKEDKIDPAETAYINYPAGSIADKDAKIWPFKVHRAKQPYDLEFKHLLVPKTVGEGGFWTDFDWAQSIELGSKRLR